MAKRTPLEEAAMRKKAEEERARLRKEKTARPEAVDEMLSAGREALNEQRRETRFKVPELEERAETAYKKGGKVSSASSRADGIAQRGKTRGMMK